MDQGRAKWLLLGLALFLSGLAIGYWLSPSPAPPVPVRDGSTFYRQLADDTGPNATGNTYQGPLAVRLRGYALQIIRSEPERFLGSEGWTTAFCAVLMHRGTPEIDRDALLNRIEKYLKEIAGAAKTKIEDHIDGKRVGFLFKYEATDAKGEVNVHLYNITGEIWGDVVLSMDVREQLPSRKQEEH